MPASPETGWEALRAAIDIARVEIAAAAPDAATAAEGEACLARVMTSGLGDAFLGHLLIEGGLTRTMPTIGGPLPDYRMLHAMIDPARRYRLEGCLHESERVGIGLYSFGAGGVVLLAGYAAFDRTNTGADGCFALDLAADASGPNTLAITADCRALMIRILHRSPQGRACTLTLSGGGAQPGLGLTTGSAEGALAHAAQRTLGSIRQFLEWSRLLSANPNRIATPPPSLAAEVQGDPDTGYYLGYYDLNDGECLEVTIPDGIPGYWSLYAYNHWLESLPEAGVHDLNAVADPDGRVRVRIGPGGWPDCPNRVDTLGRKRGVLIFRTIGTADIRVPEARLLARGC